MSYAYATGRIKAVEARMIDESKLVRMIDADSLSNAFAVLAETDYALNLGKLSHAFDFEELAYLELKSVKELMDRLVPENRIINSLFMKYDFNNAKTILKIKHQIEEQEEILIDVGTIDINSLRDYITQNLGKIKKEIADAVRDAEDTYIKTKDSQMIDIVLDRHYFKIVEEEAERSKVPYFCKIVEAWIDLTNIKSFLRCKELKKSKDFYASAFIPHGELPLSTFKEIYDETIDHLFKKLKYTFYSQLREEVIIHLIDKLMDNYLIELIKKAKYMAFGIEPIIGYLLAKEGEIKTVRMILVCKANSIKGDFIKERLRTLYV